MGDLFSPRCLWGSPKISALRADSGVINGLTFHNTVSWVSFHMKRSLLVKAVALSLLLGEHTCLCKHIHLHKSSLPSQESGNPPRKPDSKEKEEEGKMGKQRGGGLEAACRERNPEILIHIVLQKTAYRLSHHVLEREEDDLDASELSGLHPGHVD